MPLAETETKEEGEMAPPEDAERIGELTNCGGWTDPAPPKTRKTDGQTLDPPVAGCTVIYYYYYYYSISCFLFAYPTNPAREPVGL